MINNEAVFNRVWQKVKPYGLAFISSNGGTGKTTNFNFKLLHDALKHDVKFHIFCRNSYELPMIAERFLQAQPTYSRRKLKMLDKCEVNRVNDRFIYIVEKDTGRNLAQVLPINTQAFYKRYGNTIGATRAIFDEILEENGAYCPDEINKFNRLIKTMSRSNVYHVYCLYNNTSPHFPYFKYYGGKSYATHISDCGALFYYFTAPTYAADKVQNDPQSIQSIIDKTDYGNVYNRNMFLQYPQFYKAENLKTAKKLFKIEIETRLFMVKLFNETLFIDRKNAFKRSKKAIYTLNDAENSSYRQAPPDIRNLFAQYIAYCRLKTNVLNDTIFIKKIKEIC